MYSEQITQRLGFATPLHPQTINTTTVQTGGLDLSMFHRAFAILDVGAVTNGGSLTVKWQESNDNSTFTDLSNGLSNISQTAIVTASKIYTFEVRADQITKRYVRLSVQETGGQNVTICAILYGDEAIHKPGSAQNAGAVSTQNVAA